ncbi:MAG: coproporphyrinogen dehydrogenase HemZ [Oscillospiraceae bacterium]
MKLEFSGHTYQYAVEQTLLALFPTEHPGYEAILPGDDAWAKSSLSRGTKYWVAVTRLHYHGREASAVSRMILPPEATELEAEREKQRIVKLSFFKAALGAADITPPWGALTGIRPGKMAARHLAAGKTEAAVDRILRDDYYVTAPRRQLCLETARQGLTEAARLAPRDIAVYMDIPFCPTRCVYCSFVSSSVENSFALVEPYLAALHDELAAAGKMVRDLDLRVRSFYMGGGTPTTLTAEQMDELLTRFEGTFDLSACDEITIEAGRPDTISPEKLAVLRRHNTTRVSINPQSMEEPVLRAIGRRHTAEDIERAMEQVRAVGFPHVNMDLIAGLPEDTPEGFRRSLDRVLALGADNITVHTLSLKKGSRLLLEGSKIPEAEAVAEMLNYADPVLRGAGFTPYYLYRQKYMSGNFENTGWCLPGSEGLYNIDIMEELCSILSLGAGGSTKMVDVSTGQIERAFNLKYPKEYTERPEKWQAGQAAFAAFYRSHPAQFYPEGE